MNNQINDFVSKYDGEQFATGAGREIHAKLQKIYLSPTKVGDAELIAKIENAGDELKLFFMENSTAEVPIAGFINKLS